MNIVGRMAGQFFQIFLHLMKLGWKSSFMSFVFDEQNVKNLQSDLATVAIKGAQTSIAAIEYATPASWVLV